MHSLLPLRLRLVVGVAVLGTLGFLLGLSGQIGERFHLPASTAVPAVPTTQPAVKALEGAVHPNIVTTVFWVGEGSSGANGGISNAASAWVDDWLHEFGGEDSPLHRNGYLPAGFTPAQNVFYAALPYNDYDGNDRRKSDAERCLSATGNQRTDYSWCKNAWLKISLGTRTVYAQWEDVGPFNEDDAAYVFDGGQPRNTQGEHAGLDMSPATRDYLVPGTSDGPEGTYRTSWQFVPFAAVPPGPWLEYVTTTPGRPAGQ